jgi:hypothetical protein
MAKQTINIGTSANDGTGDTLRAAFDICNDNFTELYDGTGGLLHKIEGTNFTGSLLIGHSTTGTLDNATNNVGIGIGALDALTTGDSNIAIGYNTGTSLQSGNQNILIGATAGDALTSGGQNVAIGHNALGNEDGHGRNVAVGHSALENLNAGTNANNVAIGYEAGQSVTTGAFNVIIGALAGDSLTTGPRNTAIGYQALTTEDEGRKNTAIGYNALKVLNVDGDGDNVAIGHQAGLSVTTGKKNTIIGGDAGDALTTGSNNIIIGYEAAASAVDVSNEVTIGDSNITNVRIPSDSTLKIGASGDLQLEHLSSNSFIKNTAVGDLYIENQVDDSDVIFRSDDGSGGLATYFYLDGSGTNGSSVTGATVFPDASKIYLGTGKDLEIFHNGSQAYIENYTGEMNFTQHVNDGDMIFKCDDGSGGTETYFFLDGSIGKTKFPDSKQLVFGDSGDLRILHDGTDSFINSDGTGDLYIQQFNDDKDIIFKCDDGSGGVKTYFYCDGSQATGGGTTFTKWGDNSYISLGDGSDLYFFHNGTDTKMQNQTGDLVFEQTADNNDIIFKSDDGSGGVTEYFRVDGDNEHVVYSKPTIFSDSVSLKFGDGSDLVIQHNQGASLNQIDNNNFDLYIQQNADDKDIIFRCDDGSGGLATYFFLDGSLADGTNVFTKFIDNSWITMGNGGDLLIGHQVTSSKIENYTGHLYIANKADDQDIIFQSDDGSGGLTEYLRLDGSDADGTYTYTRRPDGGVSTFGNDKDLRIWHDPSTNFSYIRNYTNDFSIENVQDDGDIIFKSDDGSGGTATYMYLDGGNTRVQFNKEARFVDDIGVLVLKCLCLTMLVI